MSTKRENQRRSTTLAQWTRCGDTEACPGVEQGVSREWGIASNATLMAGFGSAFEPATDSGSSQQAAGAIHWQCCISSGQPPSRAQHSCDPAATEEVAARKPTIKVAIKAQLIAR